MASATTNERNATTKSRIAIPDSQIKLIFGYSAGWCAFPECDVRNLVDETSNDPAVVIGEIAHIHSYEDGGPRANPTLSLKERNQYSNLVLFCPTHHRLVDKQESTYSAEQLKSWKKQLETRVKHALARALPQLGFFELRLITANLLAQIGSRAATLDTIPPAEKMEKNGLSASVGEYLRLALGRANVVAEYIDSFTRVDQSFADRLRAGFVQRYTELKRAGVYGDELFAEMLDFASAGGRGLSGHAAGLALLGYFFEACEVFEK